LHPMLCDDSSEQLSLVHRKEKHVQGESRNPPPYFLGSRKKGDGTTTPKEQGIKENRDQVTNKKDHGLFDC
jgi:hypothetical protein